MRVRRATGCVVSVDSYTVCRESVDSYRVCRETVIGLKLFVNGEERSAYCVDLRTNSHYFLYNIN